MVGGEQALVVRVLQGSEVSRQAQGRSTAGGRRWPEEVEGWQRHLVQRVETLSFRVCAVWCVPPGPRKQGSDPTEH